MRRLLATSAPAPTKCKKCDGEMRLVILESTRTADTSTFQCEKCGATEVVAVLEGSPPPGERSPSSSAF
jgi:Zn finger protein HypA/HybF involved in hydrogenase expression